MTPLRQRMLEELQLRNLSEATIQTYLRLVERFAKHFGISPAKLGPDHVRHYLLHLLNDRKDTWGTIQVNRGALKFLYVRVLKQAWFDVEIAAPKKRLRLPIVMSPDDITRILDRTTNLKHWTIIATFYATALRCNELRHLKVSDIDGPKMVLHVREGKGSVPRDIPLSPVLLERLRIYYRGCKPTDWLFPSKQRRDQPLDDNSIRALCRDAGSRAGIKHLVHPHLFRHACATHMLDAGTDLRTIQVLLGHADIRTTAKYLRVSLQRLQSARSPFDALQLQPIDYSDDGRRR
ncbi:MAG: site-specific integrase [Acidobacteriia bacterium]|nr:site-specific integrase [Terriglobia bacterium]